MAERLFDRELVPSGTDQRRPAYIIRCSRCDNTQTAVFNTFGGSMASEPIQKKFKKLGWDVSKKNGHDLCPDCVQTSKEARAKLRLVNQPPAPPQPVPVPLTLAKPTVPEEAPVAQKPILTLTSSRPMTREDRRVIFAKLDEVYLDESRGYSPGWHDQKVATDLGVPMAWVKEIREENFGPEGTNEDWRKVLDEAKTLSNRLQDLLGQDAEIQRKVDALLKERAELTTKINRLKLDIDRITRGVTEIEKAVRA